MGKKGDLMNIKAFTLAEVLITLGIIGIVSAMTMPALIQKNQDKELISRAKKVYSDFNNVMLLSQQDYGVIGDNSFLFNEKDDALTVARNINKYFKGAKLCENANQDGCESYYYNIKYATKRYSSDNTTTTENSRTRPKIILSNGAIIAIDTNKSGCALKEYTGTNYDENGLVIKNPDGSISTTTYKSSICANIFFDVNGAKKPNQFGHDSFWFWVQRSKLEPASEYVGGTSLKNILTGSDKLKYEYYAAGQKFEF